ncbi:MAG: hypothetical protein PHP90_10080 [Sulfuricurvum sp.]|uniref:hypothetical protein n=1 Tax=Sulfuricurvum sp. TaxID=2025608 RepID=UPI002631EC7A|nr:hypothetical protein [Sulfuricurvum sp.]MDD5118926.1 hypothetical protein [Sulfuricurvum sp.]
MNNLTIKAKLLIIPLTLIIVFLVTYLIYSNANTSAEKALDRASDAKLIENEFLQTRISVYQFLKNPNQDTLDKVHTNLDANKQLIMDLKEKLSIAANKKKCDEAIAFADNYRTDFDQKAPLIINAEIIERNKIDLSTLIATSKDLAKSLDEIAASAVELSKSKSESVGHYLALCFIFALAVVFLISYYVMHEIRGSIHLLETKIRNFVETKDLKIRLIYDKKDEIKVIIDSSIPF